MAKTLWKYDDELGYAYFCPKCRRNVCGSTTCWKCGQTGLEYTLEGEPYTGRTYWMSRREFVNFGG